MLHSNFRVFVIILFLFHGLLCLPSHNVYKCQNKREWKSINYDMVGLKPPRDGAKILQATKDSCVVLPFKIEAASILQTIVFVNTTLQESGITIFVFNEKQNIPAVEYTYNKFNEDFSLGWHTILLTIHYDIDGYICLLGSSQDNEVALIASVSVYKYDSIPAEGISRITPLRNLESIKNYLRRKDGVYNYSNKATNVILRDFYHYNEIIKESAKFLNEFESVSEIENNKSNINKNQENVDIKDDRIGKEHANTYENSNGNDENNKNHQNIVKTDDINKQNAKNVEKNDKYFKDINPEEINTIKAQAGVSFMDKDENSIVVIEDNDIIKSLEFEWKDDVYDNNITSSSEENGNTTTVTDDADDTDETTTTEMTTTTLNTEENTSQEDTDTTDDNDNGDDSITVTLTTTTQDPDTEDNSFWTPLTIGLIAGGGITILAIVFVIAYYCGKEKGIEQTYGNLNGVKEENIIDPPQKKIVPRVKNIYKEGESPSNRYNWYN